MSASPDAPHPSSYYDSTAIRKQVERGAHRDVIGGLWEEVGELQAEFLKSAGLEGRHAFIDVGAGSFRAGVKLVPYLDPGNYYAVDLQASLLEAGYAKEIEPAGLASRFPRANFATTDKFDVSGFGRKFDFGIAQSVFTHLPIAMLGQCLSALEPHFNVGGKYFVTIFLVPEDAYEGPYKQKPGDIITKPRQDPYHNTLIGLRNFAERVAGWRMEVIGDWSHPRNQQMLCFTRVA